MQLQTAGLLIIENRKLLLAFSKNKKCFYLPGGKIDRGETAAAALCREADEELNIQLTENDLKYYTHISAPAYGEAPGVIMEQDCFFAGAATNPYPAAEIGELRFFSCSEYLQETVTAPGVVMVMKELQNDDYID